MGSSSLIMRSLCLGRTKGDDVGRKETTRSSISWGKHSRLGHGSTLRFETPRLIFDSTSPSFPLLEYFSPKRAETKSARPVMFTRSLPFHCQETNTYESREW